MAQQFNIVPLFGGAITASLPSTFADVSEIRQVPDNQEVYLDTDGYTSIIFEILERVDKPDAEALDFHLKDLVEDGDEEGGSSALGETKIWTRAEVHFAKLPQGTPSTTLLATTPPGPKHSRGQPNDPDSVTLLLTLLRLERQNTDILVGINVPHVPQQYDPAEIDFAAGKYGALVERAMGYWEGILGSFEILDWGLFVQE